MQLKKDKSFLQDFSQAAECEYLETNGLGVGVVHPSHLHIQDVIMDYL